MSNISDLIKHLQEVLEESGDLPLVYSSDDDGNSYHQLFGFGEAMYFEDMSIYYLEPIDKEELKDYENYVEAYCIN